MDAVSFPWYILLCVWVALVVLIFGLPPLYAAFKRLQARRKRTDRFNG